jgi:hypothetical protein
MLRLRSNAWKRSAPPDGTTSKSAALTSGSCVTRGARPVKQPRGTTPSGVKDGVSGTSRVPSESPGGLALLPGLRKHLPGDREAGPAQPDRMGLILAADGVVLLLGLVRPALRMRGLLRSGALAQGTMVGTVQKTMTETPTTTRGCSSPRRKAARWSSRRRTP